MDMPKKQLMAEALMDLHRRLSTLPTRSHERRMIMQETAKFVRYIPRGRASDSIRTAAAWQGYNVKVLAELLNAKPREIRWFLSGHLAPGRTQELQSELLAAGIPL